VQLRINGRSVELDDAEGDTPLLWVIRDHLGLTGTKYGCGIGLCGSCTVHLDGRAVRACVVSASNAVGKQIRTIEGLADADPHPVQAAWTAAEVPQCGYCQPGMIMAITALLAEHPEAGPDELISRLTNICTCGSYPRIRRAIEALRPAKGRADEVGDST